MEKLRRLGEYLKRNLPCLDCGGFGTIGVSGKFQRTEEKCPTCDGTGKKVNEASK